MIQPNLLTRSFKWFLRLSALLALVLLVGGAWLLSAPREITRLSEAIIQQLQPDHAPFELRVGKVALHWQSWDKPAHLQLEAIELVSAVHDASTMIPSGGVDLKMLPLLWGRVQVSGLQLEGMQGELHIGKESLYWVNEAGQLFYRYRWPDSPPDASPSQRLPIDAVTLNFKQLKLKDLQRDMQVSLEQTQLQLRQTEQSLLTLKLHANTQFGAKAISSIALNGEYDRQTQTGKAQLLFDTLNPQALCAKGDWCRDMPALDMPLAGGVQLEFLRGAPKLVTLALNGKKGTLAFKPHLPEIIALDALEVKAQLDVATQSLALSGLTLEVQGGTRITASGAASYPNEQLTLRAKGRAEQMPVDHLYRYWPAGLAPATRKWATSRIRGGMAKEAEVSIALSPEDLEATFLPDGFLTSRIEVYDTTVDYLPGFPKVEKARATVRFTGTTMSADVLQGSAFSGTQIAGSHLLMSDMNAAGTPMTTDLVVRSNPADVAQILKRLPNPALKDAAAILAGASGGEISGKMKLGFNAFGASKGGAINWDALRYDLDAKLQNLGRIMLHKALPVQTVSGVLTANDDAFSANLSSRDGQARYQLSAASKAGKPLSWSLKGYEAAQGGALLQDFSGEYGKDKSGKTQLAFRGNRLDLQSLIDAPSGEDEGGLRLSQLAPFSLDVNLQELRLSGGNSLHQVAGAIDCPNRCESANLYAQLGTNGGSVAFKIFREAGQRKLQMASDRLGDLLRLFDAQGKVFEGSIELQGVYDDALPESPLAGRVIMKEFFLRDTPILGRILNAGSLVGLLDTLKGDGIRFDKFAANYRFANDLLRLKDGKAAGPAMGVLVDGDFNLATDKMDINGNLAPAYLLNSLVGKVPLIGGLLVGGEGESVFAINYSARGDMDDPSVTVNPLSALTPGFTRRFFDVFEGERDTGEVAPKAPAPQMPALKAPLVPAPAAPVPKTPAAQDSKWQVINP